MKISVIILVVAVILLTVGIMMPSVSNASGTTNNITHEIKGDKIIFKYYIPDTSHLYGFTFDFTGHLYLNQNKILINGIDIPTTTSVSYYNSTYSEVELTGTYSNAIHTIEAQYYFTAEYAYSNGANDIVLYHANSGLIHVSSYLEDKEILYVLGAFVLGTGIVALARYKL